MITKREVLEFFEDQETLGMSVSARQLVRHFRDFQLTQRAAEEHLIRLRRQALIHPTSGDHFILTARGRRRLEWYRGETSGGTITFA